METPKRYLAKISTWLFRIIIVLLVLIFLVLSYFSWQTNQRESKNNVEAAPSTGRFVKAADIQIFIQEMGPTDGVPVLFVHGTGAWSEIWRETMKALAGSGYRAIAIDVPPFGFSEKPEGPEEYSRENQAKRIIGILDSLGIDRVNLVGHSVGARPTIEAALNEQIRIQNLILVDPALGFVTDGDAQFEQNTPSWLFRSIFAIKPLRNAVLSTYGTNPIFTKKLFQSFVSNEASITNERVKTMQKPLAVYGMTRAQGDWLENFLLFLDTSLTSDITNLKNLTIPTLIIWGSADSVTPLWQGKTLTKLIPNSELKVMTDIGHIPYIEDTETFNNILLNFLNNHK